MTTRWLTGRSGNRATVVLVGLIVLAAWLAPSPSRAVPIVFTLVSEVTPGVTFSTIHSAAGQSLVDPVYYSVGEEFFNASGQFVGDLTGGVLTLSASTLSLSVVSVFITPGVWTLDILGGTLTDVGGGIISGTIGYDLRRDGFLEASGQFVIDPLLFGGGPNTMSPTQLILWANNWFANPTFHGTTQTRAEFVAAGGIPLGIDFKGVVPEASGALLLLGGLLAALQPRYARR